MLTSATAGISAQLSRSSKSRPPRRTVMITFDNVSKVYPDGTVAVDKLTLTAPNGKITTLVGPSGCGKTTSMRMINRLIEPSSGTIELDGVDTQTLDRVALRRRIGYVIQNAGLFPHRTVVDNVAALPRLLGGSKKETRSGGNGTPGTCRSRREVRPPVSVAAVRRSAAASRSCTRAGNGSALPADGRAVQCRRPDSAQSTAGRVSAPAGRHLQDDRHGHARHRRGPQAGRPGCGAT